MTKIICQENYIFFRGWGGEVKRYYNPKKPPI